MAWLIILCRQSVSDKKGIIWVGTKNGLSAFNGTEWTTYRVENGMVSNNILSIVVDKMTLFGLELIMVFQPLIMVR